jgi:hypothetical protein
LQRLSPKEIIFVAGSSQDMNSRAASLLDTGLREEVELAADVRIPTDRRSTFGCKTDVGKAEGEAG